MAQLPGKDGRITNLRALAILLVVFGHSIILYSSRWHLFTAGYRVPALDRIKDWINLLQMPLFFSLSGYLFYGKKENPGVWQFLWGKLRRLMIPFLFVGLCWLLPVRLLVDYPGYRGKSLGEVVIRCILLGYDDGHLWYLPCLFGCFCLSRLLQAAMDRLKVSRWVQLAAVVLAALALHIFRGQFSVPVLRNIALYWVWFAFGGLIRQKLWLLGLPCIAAWLYLAERDAWVALLLVAALYCLMPRKSCRVTQWLSDYSFGLYLFHSPLVYITYTFWADKYPALVVLANFALFGALAALLTLAFKKTPLRLLIGEGKPARPRENEVIPQ